MPTTYTSLLGFALPATGELSGTWGDTVNNYITQYVDAAVAGAQIISGSQTAVTLSVTNGSSLVSAGSGATGSSQYAIIRCTGNPASLLTVTAPAANKVYLVINATSTNQSVKVVGAGPTTGITIAASRAALIAWNGSDFVLIATTDITQLSGTLAVANGGTGITSFGTGVATALGQNVTGSGGIVLAASPTMTGSPIAPTQVAGTNNTTVATTAFVTAAISAALLANIYPVGSIYINATNSTNPGTLLGFGTWTAFGAGRVPVGFNASDPLFDSAEETGGSANAIVVSHTHTGTTSTVGNHQHGVPGNYIGSGITSNGGYLGGADTTTTSTTAAGSHNHTFTTDSSGSSGTNANYQPYITVYMWKRTA